MGPKRDAYNCSFLVQSMKENYARKRNLEKFSTSSYLGIFKYISLYKYKLSCRMHLNIKSVRGNHRAK